MTSGGSERDRKGGLSCAECRRSKLKCDRVFPCQSCIRRGCGHICPNGTLAATKGNKVLMAHAQRLAEQVKSANTRIEALERALSEAQTQTGREGPHPLLQLNNINDTETSPLKTIFDDGIYGVSEAIGSLSIGLDGKAKYHGESAGSEYLQRLIDMPPYENSSEETNNSQHLGMPFEIMDLVNAFPMGLKDCSYNKSQFVSFLPSRERAIELADIYYKNVAFMYDPIVRSDFMNTIVSPIYGTGYVSVDTLHSHKLSVFFIAMACGALYESHPSASTLAQQYYSLSRAAFSLDSILQEANCATVQALFMTIRFKYISDPRGEERWLLGGLCVKVAQIIGLQRDSAGWNLDPDEVQRRRVLFWELYTSESWSGLVHGRPPALNIQHTDCRFPDDLDPCIKPSGDVEYGYHAWKFRYSASCLSVAVQHVFGIKSLSYSALLEVDKKIRQFSLPTHLQAPIQTSDMGCAWSSDQSRANQQYCVLCERESNLLYIHRSSFAQAIRASPQDPLSHEYAPSVLATYRSACRLISGLKCLYAVHPDLCSRQWFFWSSVFSSCIVLGALVVESTGCTLAQDALQEMEEAVPFFLEGSRLCRPSATSPMLQKLLKRAQTTYAAFYTGSPSDRISTRHNSDEPDELEVLGGRTNVITNKSSSNSPVSNLAASSPSHRLSLSTDMQEDTLIQSTRPEGRLWISNYHTLGQPLTDTQVSRDFNLTPPSEIPSSDGYGYAHGLASAVRSPFQQGNQAYSPQHHLPQHSAYMQAPNHQLQQPGPVDIALHSQNDIWRDFMGHLGLTRPMDE